MEHTLILTLISPNLFFGLLTSFWDNGMDLLIEININDKVILRGVRQDKSVIKIGICQFSDLFQQVDEILPFSKFYICPERTKKWQTQLKYFKENINILLTFNIDILKTNKAVCKTFNAYKKNLIKDNGDINLISTSYNPDFEKLTISSLMSPKDILFTFNLKPMILQKILVNENDNLSIFYIIEEYGEILVFTDNFYRMIITDHIKLISEKEECISLHSKYLKFLTINEEYLVRVSSEYIHFEGTQSNNHIFIKTNKK